jgi:hypothetical protein
MTMPSMRADERAAAPYLHSLLAACRRRPLIAIALIVTALVVASVPFVMLADPAVWRPYRTVKTMDFSETSLDGALLRPSAAPPSVPRGPTSVSSSALDSLRATEEWQTIKETTDPGLLRSFADRFPASAEAARARARLNVLEREDQEWAEAMRKAELERALREKAEALRKAEAEKADRERAARSQLESIPQAAPLAGRIFRGAPAETEQLETQKLEEMLKRAVESGNVQFATHGPPDIVARYPTIEAVDRVAAGRPTTVLVSLTVDQVTPQVKVLATGGGARKTAEGALAVPMPPNRTRMPIKVVLHTAGFDLDPATPEEATIELDRTGDSTSAKFRITARPDAVGTSFLRVTFWRDNEFLANLSRKIEIVAPPALASNAAAEQQQRAPHSLRPRMGTPPALPNAGESPMRLSAESEIPIVLRPRPIDLKIEVVYDDPRQLGHGHATIASDYIGGLRHGEVNHSPDLIGWLDGFYREFRAPPALDQVSGDAAADTAAWKEARLRRLRAFGAELYRRAAPPVLQQALARLLADPTVTLRTIQIYSNNPLVPWELMRAPKPEGGSTDFFGIAFALARGQEDDEQITLRPPQEQPVNEVVTIAPAYGAQGSLASSSREIEQIRALLASRQVAGRKSDFISLLHKPPAGIVHFAGHGEVAGQTAVERRFAILFEDGRFDVMDWRGLSSGKSAERALYFFNACELGQAESIAGAVEGWGPAVLSKGASGYIGGLWPLRDEPAARFAIAFYQVIAQELAHNKPAHVAQALAQARRLVYETGDATYLAYAFYGDAQLEFVRAR